MEDVKYEGLNIYLTNLGKYNEGILQGEWLKLPCTQEEYKACLDRIGINDEYEETFISDIDNYYPFDLSELIGEYTDFKFCNALAEKLDELTDEEQKRIDALNEEGFSIEDSICNVLDGNGLLYEDIRDERDYGNHLLNEVGVEGLGEYVIQDCFDYEQFGRDERKEYYPEDENYPETAGEYYCGNENATDYEIGQAVVDDTYGGIENMSKEKIESYLDLEEIGKLCLEGNEEVLTDYGLLDYSDCENEYDLNEYLGLSEENEEEEEDER